MEWINIKDRLPEEGVQVLIYFADDKKYKVDYIVCCPEPIWACTLEREEYKVTHWMPLPESPKYEQKTQKTD